jgi:hypothetical protein
VVEDGGGCGGEIRIFVQLAAFQTAATDAFVLGHSLDFQITKICMKIQPLERDNQLPEVNAQIKKSTAGCWRAIDFPCQDNGTPVISTNEMSLSPMKFACCFLWVSRTFTRHRVIVTRWNVPNLRNSGHFWLKLVDLVAAI